MVEENFVEADVETDGADFYADTKKGVVTEGLGLGADSDGSGSDNLGDRSTEPPEQQIDENRDIVYTDPHVHEAIMTLVDWTVGDGYNLAERTERQAGAEQGASGPSSDETSQPTDGGQDSNTEQLRSLLRNGREFWPTFVDWVRTAMVDGNAFMQLAVEDGVFYPKVLPTKEVNKTTNKYGEVVRYRLQIPSGTQANTDGGEGGAGGSTEVFYEPHEIAELTFRQSPKDDFGRSLVEPIREQADMLRDMEIDYARFIATKAYPPILWRLGTEDSQWTENQVNAFMDNVNSIGPDSMLAAPHDVEAEIVGSTSTSSTAGAMRLEETFRHFENRVVTGLGVPRVLMNMEAGGQGEATATMPSFRRRVDRLQNRVKAATEEQILQNLLVESVDADRQVVPQFQFGEHSSAEKRLQIDKLLKLFNNGLLTPEAFAERAGIDPEELPEFWGDDDVMSQLQRLAGTGDVIQNPNGGNTTETEGGVDTAGREATAPRAEGTDEQSSRSRRSVAEDESG